MPDSAPRGYKKLVEMCCNADPDKRPDVQTLYNFISEELKIGDCEAWNTVYHNDVRSLSRLEKESKYSSLLLPTGDFPKPRNSYEMSIEFQI